MVGEGEEVMVVSGDEEMIKLGSLALPGAERSGSLRNRSFRPCLCPSLAHGAFHACCCCSTYS